MGARTQPCVKRRVEQPGLGRNMRKNLHLQQQRVDMNKLVTFAKPSRPGGGDLALLVGPSDEKSLAYPERISSTHLRNAAASNASAEKTYVGDTHAHREWQLGSQRSAETGAS